MSSVISASDSDSYVETGSESLLSSPSESPVSEVAVAALKEQPNSVSSLRTLIAHPVYDRSLWAQIAAYTPEVPHVFADPENNLLFDTHFSAPQREQIVNTRQQTIQKLFQDPQNIRALNESIGVLSFAEIEAQLTDLNIYAFRHFCSLAVQENCASILLALLASNRIHDIPAVYLKGTLKVFARLNLLNGIEACRTCTRAPEFDISSVKAAFWEAIKKGHAEAINALLHSPSFPMLDGDALEEAFAIAVEKGSLDIVQTLISFPLFHLVENETLIWALIKAEELEFFAIAEAILATNRLHSLRHSV